MTNTIINDRCFPSWFQSLTGGAVQRQPRLRQRGGSISTVGRVVQMFFLFLSCYSSINRYFCCCCWMFVVVVECFVLHVWLFLSVCCFFVSSGPSCIGKTITVCGTSWVRRWPTAVEVNKPFPRTKKHCPLNPSRWHVLIVMPTLLLVSAFCLCIVFPHLVFRMSFCLSLPINTIFETRFLPQAFYFSSSEMTTTIQYDSIVISVVFPTSFNFFHPFQ